MKPVTKIKPKLLTILLLILCVNFIVAGTVLGAGTLPNRSLQPSSSRAGEANVQYLLSFTTTANYVLGSMTIEFCQNSPLIVESCTPSVGFDASTSTVLSQAGAIGFSVSPASTASKLILTRPPALSTSGQKSYVIGGIHNPSNLGTHYARLQTFVSNDGSGPAIDEGGLTYNMSQPLEISLEVPPYLYFCVAQTIPGYDCRTVSSGVIDLGDFSSATTRTGTSQFVVATNGQYGVLISVTGTTLTSGNNIIANLTSPTSSSRGTSQFGMNLVANSQPSIGASPVGQGTMSVQNGYNTPNLFKFASGDTIAASSHTTAENKFTVSYIVNINKNQQPGVYSTTLLYNALASF